MNTPILGSAVDRVLQAAERNDYKVIPGQGGNWTLQCPNTEGHSHGDRTPSLSLSQGSDRALLKCFGCDLPGDELGVLYGLDKEELFDDFSPNGNHPAPAPRNGTPPPRPEFVPPSEEELAGWRAAVRDNPRARAKLAELKAWTDGAGEVCEVGHNGSQITFPMRDDDGELVGVSLYLPNPAMREGRSKMTARPGSKRRLFPPVSRIETEPGEWLFVCEGEPDSVSAASIELPATGIPGVQNWRDDWAPAFAGRKVALLLDCDPQGRACAQKAEAAIRPHAERVVTLDLGPGRDDGYDLGDLVREAGDDGREDLRKLLCRMADEADPVLPAATPPALTPTGAAPASEATAELLEAAEGFVRRYVVPPGDHEAATLALFVLHTHALEAAHATPYLIVLSPERRTGKTLLLEVIELLVARPWRIVAASEAAMFRKITQDKPTLLLDEIDAVFGSQSDRTEPLRALLNAGNRPGASVARCVGKGEITVADFAVFCPKVLAGIDTPGRLPDTIRDRGVEIRMKRKTPAERVDRFRVRHAKPTAEALRDRLAQWGEAETDTLREAEPHLPDALNDRAAEAWEPLLAIADLAGGDWPRRAQAAALALAEGADFEEATHGTRALAALAGLLSDAPAVSSKQACEAINADDELPFGGWRNGDGLDPRGLAKLLKPYGLKPRSVRLDDDKTAKGYHRDDTAEEAFARYLSPPTPPEAAQASPASQSTQNTPHSNAVVTDVPDVTDTAGMGAEEDPGGASWAA